ncbi:MAG: hypothetical protein ABJP14_21850 [Roseibium sp.]
MNEEPAASTIKHLGGVTVVSRELGVNPSTVRRFKYSAAKGGKGGLIPSRYIFPILLFSYRLGRPLSLDEIVLSPEQRRLLQTSSNKSLDPSSPENPENQGVGR